MRVSVTRKRAIRRSRVLIVNGFDDGRAMYAEYFKHHGLTVYEASNPISALAIVRRSRPDVIVTDFVFPGEAVDGPTFIDSVRHLGGDVRPIVIVVSGFTQPADRRRARDFGADRFLTKPCLPDQLLAEVRRAGDSQRSGKSRRS